jgi:hypothetical protein
MRFRTRNIRSLYRAGSLVTVSKELTKYKLDLVGEQEVKWENGGNELAGEYTFSTYVIQFWDMINAAVYSSPWSNKGILRAICYSNGYRPCLPDTFMHFPTLTFCLHL